MTLRLIQAAVLLALAACAASPSASADTPSSERPFEVSEVAAFDAPWAMAFLPGSGVRMTKTALITEKPGRIWLVDVGTGRKQPVSGAPRVVVSSQGGLYYDGRHEFGACLDYLLDHPTIRARMGRNGARYVAANYAWERVDATYDRVIEELSRGRRSGATAGTG